MSNTWGDQPAPVLQQVVPQRRLFFRVAVVMLLLALVPFGVVLCSHLKEQWQFAHTPLTGVIPAEFEPHEALLLGWDQRVDSDGSSTFARIVASVYKKTHVIIQIDNETTRQFVVATLRKFHVPPDAVTFWMTPMVTAWTRDYFPRIRNRFDGGMELMGFRYGGGVTVTPASFLQPLLEQHIDLPYRESAIFMHGGNLLSNGQGLCLTTRQLLKENRPKLGEAELRRTLRSDFGAKDLIILDSLQGEPTGHVDMFATFVAPDVVVVGKYDDTQDPVNARILNKNARRLEGYLTDNGPLRVVRVPMPSRVGNEWRTYTNVALVDGVLLVPSYSGEDRGALDEALTSYQTLLPGWKVVTIPADGLINAGGSLHCATMNIYHVGPDVVPPLGEGPVF